MFDCVLLGGKHTILATEISIRGVEFCRYSGLKIIYVVEIMIGSSEGQMNEGDGTFRPRIGCMISMT